MKHISGYLTKEHAFEIEKVKEYQGMTNRDTWLANLWLNNEYNMYQNFQRILKMPQGRITETRALITTGMKSKAITDTIDIDKVNYKELLERNETE